MARSTQITVIAGAALALALAAPVYAQGKSNGKSNGNGNGHKSTPPSSSPLPSPTSGPAAAASPLVWLDDATLLGPGSASLTLAAARWSGTDLSEVDVPVVAAAVGLAPRLQIGASVPHVLDGAGGAAPIGGVGTSYINAKIAVLTGGSGVKLAVSPVLEVLSESAAQASGQDRTHVGLPVSVEFQHDTTRVFGSTGFFTQGVWFAGGGVSVQPTARSGLSLSFTRSRVDDSVAGVVRDRQELTGAASYLVRPQIALFGALGRTIATTDDNGAGTTISGGVSFLFSGRSVK